MTLDDVPPEVMNAIRRHVRAKGNSAHEDFGDASADEDSLTGSFGKHMKKRITTVPGSGGWKWRVSWRKMGSGSGGGAEEKLIGADGIIQFEAFATDGSVFSKGMLFQAKKETDSDPDRLTGQCKKMEKFSPGGGAVVWYGKKEYTGQTARDCLVVAHDSMPEALGDFLADKFLTCQVGQEGMVFETEKSTLIMPESTTTIQRIRARLNKITIEVRAPDA